MRRTNYPPPTHLDARDMPVSGVGEFPYYPTPCCNAAASISDGPMYCKACYEEVPEVYGSVPLAPFRPAVGN